MRTLLAIFLFCNLALAQQSVRTIYFVRNAEKASTDANAALSPAGAKRADCLAATLKDAGVKQIYVTNTLSSQQTADPLAKQSKITPKITPAEDAIKMVRDLFYAGSGNTLVVGLNTTLPQTIARMKAGTIKLGENDYDKLFVVTTMEGSATPVVTLHYCQASATAAATPSPTHVVKPAAAPAAKKAPAKK